LFFPSDFGDEEERLELLIMPATNAGLVLLSGSLRSCSSSPSPSCSGSLSSYFFSSFSRSLSSSIHRSSRRSFSSLAGTGASPSLRSILHTSHLSPPSSSSSRSDSDFVPQLKTFRSIWGCELFSEGSTFENLFAELKRLKFNGFECSLSDLDRLAEQSESDVASLCKSLEKHDLAVILTGYSKWHDYSVWGNDSISMQLRNLEEQFQRISELPLKPQLINCHAGSDSFSERDNSEFFRGALQLARSASAQVAFETHRGRSLFSPYNALRLCREFEDLNMTGDISHWLLVCERLMVHVAEQDLLRELTPRFVHLHCRTGYTQHAQVPHTMMPQYKEEVKFFNAFWLGVFAERAKQGQIITLCPEIGPVPYTALGRDGKPIVDAWTYTNDEHRFAEERQQCEVGSG